LQAKSILICYGYWAEVIFLNVSFGIIYSAVGPAGVIPATAALVQLKVVPAVALAGG